MKQPVSGKIGGSALIAALLVSLGVHAAGFAWYYTRPPKVQIASAQLTAVSVVGSIEDLIAGSKKTLEPVEQEQPKEIELKRVEPKEIQQPQKPKELNPVETVKATEPAPVLAKQVPIVQPEVSAPVIARQQEGVTHKLTVARIEPKARATPLVPLKQVVPVKQLEKPEVLQPEPIAQVEPKPLENEGKPKELRPVKTSEVKPAKPENAEQVTPIKTEIAAVTVPIPRAAPPRPKQAEKAKPTKSKQKTAVKQKKPPQRVGNAEINQRKGSTVARAGSKSGKSGSRNGGSGNSAGNASKDNYLGKVHRKLQRAADRKYPKREKDRGREGNVGIAFVIKRNGSVSNLRVVKSSGNSKFDKAAQKAVRSAAPFPPLPVSFKTSAYSYQTTISFRID